MKVIKGGKPDRPADKIRFGTQPRRPVKKPGDTEVHIGSKILILDRDTPPRVEWRVRIPAVDQFSKVLIRGQIFINPEKAAEAPQGLSRACAIATYNQWAGIGQALMAFAAGCRAQLDKSHPPDEKPPKKAGPA